MDEQEIIRTIQRYESYKEAYKKRFFSHVPDIVVNGRHVNDTMIFPKCWFYVYDFDLLGDLLEEALNENKRVEELDDFSILKSMVTNKKKYL